MSEAHFTLSFDGPALASHEMDVADLARSLLALSAALKAAQRVTAPTAPPVSLHAKAVEPGSFEVAMVLVQPGVLEGIFDALAGRNANAAVNALALLSGTVGAIKVIQWLGGRALRRVRSGNPGSVTIETADGDTLEVEESQVPLIGSVEFRKALSDAVAPLDRDGIHEVKIKVEGEIAVRIEEHERAAFLPPELPEEEDLASTERETFLQPVGVEFDWRKWRFTEGAASSAFHASVTDETFRGMVERQEIVVGPQDLLRVTLSIRQYRDRSGALRAQNVITHVHEVIDGGRQFPFEFEGSDATEGES